TGSRRAPTEASGNARRAERASARGGHEGQERDDRRDHDAEDHDHDDREGELVVVLGHGAPPPHEKRRAARCRRRLYLCITAIWCPKTVILRKAARVMRPA